MSPTLTEAARALLDGNGIDFKPEGFSAVPTAALDALRAALVAHDATPTDEQAEVAASFVRHDVVEAQSTHRDVCRQHWLSDCDDAGCLHYGPHEHDAAGKEHCPGCKGSCGERSFRHTPAGEEPVYGTEPAPCPGLPAREAVDVGAWLRERARGYRLVYAEHENDSHWAAWPKIADAIDGAADAWDAARRKPAGEQSENLRLIKEEYGAHIEGHPFTPEERLERRRQTEQEARASVELDEHPDAAKTVSRKPVEPEWREVLRRAVEDAHKAWHRVAIQQDCDDALCRDARRVLEGK